MQMKSDSLPVAWPNQAVVCHAFVEQYYRHYLNRTAFFGALCFADAAAQCCRRAGLPRALAAKLLSIGIPAQSRCTLLVQHLNFKGRVSAALVGTYFTGWC